MNYQTFGILVEREITWIGFNAGPYPDKHLTSLKRHLINNTTYMKSKFSKTGDKHNHSSPYNWFEKATYYKDLVNF